MPARVGIALSLLVLVAGCKGAGSATPEQKCNEYVSVVCRKVFECGAGSAYASEAACQEELRNQASCASWTLPTGCTIDWSAFDRCLGDVKVLSCAAASTGQLPASCSGAAVTPPVCPGSDVYCGDNSSSSSNNVCSVRRSNCTDSKKYELACDDTGCRCKVDDVVTRTAAGLTDCTSDAATLNMACDWNFHVFPPKPDMAMPDLTYIPPDLLTPDLVPGCVIGGTTYAPDTVNPQNLCEKCSPSESTTDWSNNHNAKCGGDCALCQDRECKPTAFIGGGFKPRSLVLASGFGYWVDAINNGYLKQAWLGGGAPPTLASSQPTPVAIAVDATHAYWVNRGSSPGLGSVAKVPLAGGAVVPLASTLQGPSAIAVRAGFVYWTDDVAGTVGKISTTGTGAVTLATGQGAAVGIAVDATSVYWTSSSLGTVMKVAVGGGAPVQLAAGQASPLGLVVDASSVYWVNRGTSGASYTDGTVMKVALGGGAPVQLAAGQGGPSAITVDATTAWWVNEGDGKVMKVGLGGGVPVQVAHDQVSPNSIGTDGKCLYWATDGDPIMRGPR